MLKTLCFVTISAIVAALVSVPQAQAAILWNWSFGGTEAGTFETDGDFSDFRTEDYFTFTIDPSTFEVTNSDVYGITDSDFSIGSQGDIGFHWVNTAGPIPDFFSDRNSYGFSVSFLYPIYRPRYSYHFSSSGNGSFFAGGGLSLVTSGSVELTPVAPNTIVVPDTATVPEPSIILGLVTVLGFSALCKRQNFQEARIKASCHPG